MLNRDVYQTDPSTRRLVNEGVASVNDDASARARAVLRYELETFVCGGQYEKGIADLLSAFLANVGDPTATQQPGVWISGFYGSGKSHLCKMLRSLWMDTEFADGATARGIAHLPNSVSDLLKELSVQGKRLGGLHAASGTLSASADGSVRLAILEIIFRSVGLPERYPQARFVMWLRDEGILDQVRAHVEQHGSIWEEEVSNLYVADDLHTALVAAKPSLFPSTTVCAETLYNQFPNRDDISNQQMTDAIKGALTKDGKFPLTLLVLDEVQIYIGDSAERSRNVKEATEACSKGLGPRFMMVATGQSAITGTQLLSYLLGRFTLRVELSDADVDTVIRKVLLAKKSHAIGEIDRVMTANLGEISKHLMGSSLAHRQDDQKIFAQDYPILPVRRRFWENTLRILDQSGTDSQLRNQLSLIHDAIRTDLDDPLGTVVPADFLYFDSASKLLQARILPRALYDNITVWREGDAEEQLLARACALVFLINKMAAANKEIGIKATVATIADLLVENLDAGSAGLRSRLPALLDDCDLVMRVGDEYRIQTEESAAWNDEFAAQKRQLAGDAHRVNAERDDRMRRRLGRVIGNIKPVQGDAKVSRDVSVTFGQTLPEDSNSRLYLWVRDGWTVDEGSFRADARQAGNNSPPVFIHVPRRFSDELRSAIIEYKAAVSTLDKRGVPSGPEGVEARSAMETTRQNANDRINTLLDDILAGTRVLQGGGAEVLGNDLEATLREAIDAGLKRLYTQFSIADSAHWDKVYARAQKGAPDALKAIGYDGEPDQQPVCKQLLAYIGPGKSGSELRTHFEGSPYGWPRDAVDGALQVLLNAGVLRALDERGRAVDPKELDRRAIGKTTFRIESETVSAPQRIQIRKLFQQAGINQVAPNEELAAVPAFLEVLETLAARAGGEAPRPAPPSTDRLRELRMASGNEQLLAIYNQREALSQAITEWTDLAARVEARWPAWQTLERLLAHADDLPDVDTIRIQRDNIIAHRQLVDDAYLIQPQVDAITQILRDEINRLNGAYAAAFDVGMARLEANADWRSLSAIEQTELLTRHRLTEEDRPSVNVGNTEGILRTLDAISLSAFADRIAAVSGRFNHVLTDVAKMVEPETTFVTLPRSTLKTPVEVEEWLTTVSRTLREAVAHGPISLQ